jgi:hypothetical protein
LHLQELYQEVRARFPEVAEAADREHVGYWRGLELDDAYPWFHSLANVLNREMNRGVAFEVHEPLFGFIAEAALACDQPARACIDVSFVENLFWQVPESKGRPYWVGLPPGLKRLYLLFHRQPPA